MSAAPVISREFSVAGRRFGTWCLRFLVTGGIFLVVATTLGSPLPAARMAEELFSELAFVLAFPGGFILSGIAFEPRGELQVALTFLAPGFGMGLLTLLALLFLTVRLKRYARRF